MLKSRPGPARYMEANGRNLPVSLTEHARATRLTLRIEPGGRGLRITIPPHVSDRQIDEFLDRNRNWVETRIARLPCTIETVEGASIPFLGVDHRICHTGSMRGIVRPQTSNGETILRVSGPTDAMGRRLRSFFVKEARERVSAAVVRHAAELGVRPSAIRMTDTTSRWGSCSTTRTLSFSWRIVMAPPEVLDYLAAHETAHLREMNHSPRFWHLVRQLCPQMETHKTWLRRNGARLHAVHFV